MSIEREQKLYDALKRIASYTPPENLDGDEAIEMAYENVIQEAKNATRGMRRPTAPKPEGGAV